MSNWFKKRKALKLQKHVEQVANNLLKTPKLSYKSQLAIIEGAQELFKEELTKL